MSHRTSPCIFPQLLVDEHLGWRVRHVKQVRGGGSTRFPYVLRSQGSPKFSQYYDSPCPLCPLSRLTSCYYISVVLVDSIELL